MSLQERMSEVWQDWFRELNDQVIVGQRTSMIV